MRKDSKTSSFHLLQRQMEHVSGCTDLHWDNTNANKDAFGLLGKPAWCHLLPDLLQLAHGGALESFVHAQDTSRSLLAKAALQCFMATEDIAFQTSGGKHWHKFRSGFPAQDSCSARVLCWARAQIKASTLTQKLSLSCYGSCTHPLCAALQRWQLAWRVHEWSLPTQRT